jgi:hypothetical protein
MKADLCRVSATIVPEMVTLPTRERAATQKNHKLHIIGCPQAQTSITPQRGHLSPVNNPPELLTLELNTVITAPSCHATHHASQIR